MIGDSFADEIDCGSFFDHIDDLLDFPTGDLDDVAFSANADCNSAFPPIWSTHSAADSADLSVPYEDIVQLEWLSNFVDDSFSGAGTLTINTSSISPSSSAAPNQFHTSSPVSVLDSSSSSSSDSGDKKALAASKRGRPRSKRPRPPTFIPRPPQLVSPATSEAATGKASSDSENYAESCSPSPPSNKNKKIKLSFRRDRNDAFNQGVRKCLHCEVTKTPQWRAGPLGPKTLCNACGVRYKSGRLFPEYRPAASPTFVPRLHSNSHKKVIEMRTKQDEKAARSPAEESPELIPNINSGIALDYV